MREFEATDYENALSLAASIKSNANNIMDIFNGINKTMSELYGDNWISSGAVQAAENYSAIRSKYEVFYNKVLIMNDHITRIIASYQTADAAASAAAGVGEAINNVVGHL